MGQNPVPRGTVSRVNAAARARRDVRDAVSRAATGMAVKPLARLLDVSAGTVKAMRRAEGDVSAARYILLARDVPELRSLALEYWGVTPDSVRALEILRAVQPFVAAHTDIGDET